jgi:uncharacterized protein (DUF58 family)
MKLFARKDRRPFRILVAGRSLGFTPFGTRFVVITLAVGIAAVNSGSNLLYLVVSMMLSMVLLSGVLSEQALRKLNVSRALPREIFAGSPFTVRYVLANRKRRVPSFALTVSEYQADGASGRGAFLFMLPPGGQGHAAVSREVRSRGRWVISGFEVATRFPFGLFRKSVLIPNVQEKTVYPRIVPLPHKALDALSGRSGEMPSNRKGPGTDVRNLRDYLPRDDARIIHWKASARLMRLMAKEFEELRQDAVTVILDNMLPEVFRADFKERFEEAVSLAASAIHHSIFELGRPVILVTRERVSASGAGHAAFIILMEALAAIEPVPSSGVALDGLEDVLGSGTTALVLPGPDSGWARYRSQVSLKLEAALMGV